MSPFYFNLFEFIPIVSLIAEAAVGIHFSITCGNIEKEKNSPPIYLRWPGIY